MKKYTSVIILALIISSCKKYDEGPGLSLRSKKARIANTWKVNKFLRNNIDSSSTYWAEGSELVLDENGSANLKQIAYYEKDGFDTTIIVNHTGSWELVQSNNYISFILTDDFENNTSSSAFEIKKLKNKELQFKEYKSIHDDKVSDEYFLIQK